MSKPTPKPTAEDCWNSYGNWLKQVAKRDAEIQAKAFEQAAMICPSKHSTLTPWSLDYLLGWDAGAAAYSEAIRALIKE